MTDPRTDARPMPAEDLVRQQAAIAGELRAAEAVERDAFKDRDVE